MSKYEDFENNEVMEEDYDEQELLTAIRESMSDNMLVSRLTDDDLLYILDSIDDFMESRGLAVNDDDDDDDEVMEIDLDELHQYILKDAKKNELNLETLTVDDLDAIIDAENEFFGDYYDDEEFDDEFEDDDEEGEVEEEEEDK